MTGLSPLEWDVDSSTNIKWVAGPRLADVRQSGCRQRRGPGRDQQRGALRQGDSGRQGDPGRVQRESDGSFLWQAVSDKLASGRVNDWPYPGGLLFASMVDEQHSSTTSPIVARCVALDIEGFTDGENDGPFTRMRSLHVRLRTPTSSGCFDMMEDSRLVPAQHVELVAGRCMGISSYVSTSNGHDESPRQYPLPVARPTIIALEQAHRRARLGETNSVGENILHGQWSSAAVGDRSAGAGRSSWARATAGCAATTPESGEKLWEFDTNPQRTRSGRGRETTSSAPR